MQGISIIICTYNGKNKLNETLSAIKLLKATCAWELIIVDNASTDGTATYVTSLLEQSDIDWRILNETTPGLIHARLCGLRASKYDFLLYCDDDNTLANDYLEIGFDILKNNNKVGALGGCGFPVFEGKKPDWFDTYSHSFAVGPQAHKDGKISNYPAEIYGAGAFFRKPVLEHFINKGFKSGLSGRTANNLVSGEDVEWCYLIQLAGYEIWYDHRLKFKHTMPEGRMNWEYYLKLKRGIASGTGKLLPYSCLFMYPNAGFFRFLLLMLKKIITSNIIYLKLIFSRIIFFRTLTPQEELTQMIWKSKAISYWKDFFKSFRHFSYLKKSLKN